MRRVAIGVVLVACSPPPVATTPVVGQAATPGVTSKPVDKPTTKYFNRGLNVGSLHPNATRGSWELSIDGANATLHMTTQEAVGSFTVERADREAVWKTTETRDMTGPVHQTGKRLDIDLAGPNESMFLRCWHRTMKIATAGARRIPTPSRPGDCDDPGIWSPPTMIDVEALACGFGDALDGGQEEGLDGTHGYIDETLIRFVAAPGIEYVDVTDKCFQSTGLRLAK